MRTGNKEGHLWQGWGCGVAVIGIAYSWNGINYNHRTSNVYVFRKPPYPFKFAVAYYQAIAFNQLFPSNLFRHDLLRTPSIIKQIKTFFFVISGLCPIWKYP